MSYTIEHNAFIFWDHTGIHPGETVGDAFERAGGDVQWIDQCELIVRGLDEKQARSIGRYAEYLGPVIEIGPAPRNLIDVTPR